MPFTRESGQLLVDGVPLRDIAEAVGTPVYVYSWPDVRNRYQRLAAALGDIDHRICYAVKANANLSVLSRLARLGAGFDVVSGGELERVLRAGGKPADVVFSGVGKSGMDIDFAIKCGIGTFNVESAAELRRIEGRAALLGRTAPVSIRVNPDVDPNTHPYIATGLKESKFGVPASQAPQLYREARDSSALEVVGIDCHIGSQVAETAPFEQALATLLQVLEVLAAEGIALRHIDIGGGFGIAYGGREAALDLDALGAALRQQLAGRPQTLLVEPGRFLLAEAGVLLTRVEYLKPAPAPGQPGFAVVDAAMNDLLRPALYQAWHPIDEVEASAAEAACWDVVGPVCESGDFLGRQRTLAVAEGSLLAIGCAGAYGFVQSSNYNGRTRAAEVVVDEGGFRVARKREAVSETWRLEAIV